ncbi:hypothetical protein V6N13_070859 [Hibiscus sabdariffa]|uniref:ABC transmembrane type-1 domain-containing protein n=1 Tax=Hibiscus sabdariffa TaxID=183260 RepID=A0ABR2TF64_9ROSI
MATNMHEVSTSKSREASVSGVNGENQDSESSKGDEKTNYVPLYTLFAFADLRDIMLMIVGLIGAIGNGLCMPLMTILFGDLIGAFGQNQNNNEVVDAVSEVALKFVYLAVAAGVAAFLHMSCWMVTGCHGREGREVYTVGVHIFRGFVIAFFQGWQLTLVMLSAIPLVVISGGIMTMIITKMASRGQSAYAKAATVVDQTIGSIRTVCSTQNIIVIVVFFK